MERIAKVVVVFLAILFVGACASISPAPSASPEPAASLSRPENFPEAFYTEALAQGQPVYRVVPEESLIAIRVGRAGALARLGHDHIVASRDVHGYVFWPQQFDAARADLYMPLASLSVDEPALRARAGLEAQPSQVDIDGTRTNMMKALEADREPFVTVRVTSIAEEMPQVKLNTEITLHGVTKTMVVPASLETSNSPGFYLRGKFSVNQSDFGIKPFAAIGGALLVQDRLDIEFELTMRR